MDAEQKGKIYAEELKARGHKGIIIVAECGCMFNISKEVKIIEKIEAKYCKMHEAAINHLFGW